MKNNDYQRGIRCANNQIDRLNGNVESIEKLHDKSDKLMYKNMDKNNKSYWFNRGKATAYGYYVHNKKKMK